MFDLTANQDDMNDLMGKLQATVSLGEFRQLEADLFNYQKVTDALRTKNQFTERFEQCEKGLEEKADQKETNYNFRAVKDIIRENFDLTSTVVGCQADKTEMEGKLTKANARIDELEAKISRVIDKIDKNETILHNKISKEEFSIVRNQVTKLPTNETVQTWKKELR